MYFNVGNLHCQLDNTAFVSLRETVYNWKDRKHCKNVVEATFLPNAVLAFFSPKCFSLDKEKGWMQLVLQTY